MRRIILVLDVILISLALRAQSVTYTCRYWFDMNHAQTVTTTFSESGWEAELDVGSLTEGIHSLHLHVMDTSMKWSAPQSYLFLKIGETSSSNLIYHYWFDHDFEHKQSDALGTGLLLLDVADLEDGIHTVNVMLQGSTLTATQSYLFLKMAMEDPSTEMQYICWFDQDYSNAQIGPLGGGLFELEVGDLSNGIHTVNVQLSNGTHTSPQCYLFYKQPLGGYGIARWEYWLNDDIANRQITDISPTIDTLDIISLLNVGHPSLRSSCFHFHPNGDAPYINAKNQINFRFYDSELRLIDKSAYYVDEQVQQDIVATVFERNTSETFAAPRNNQIQWFKVEAGVGDSLAFVADKACTMQLFAPSGEEVYAATASETMVVGGCHAWEDGTYYLAVHDVTGSGEMVSVMYQYVHKYAVLAYDVHLVGNGGCSTITFQGNGFNSLLDVYLVNAQNDTIPRLDIGHESNTTTTVTFNFYEVNLGVYDAVFEFYDETVRINGALEVQEPVDIVLSSTVSYPSLYLRNTIAIYTYTITNNGNMSAYAVPIYLYISTESIECISHVELEGLELLELKDYVDMELLTQDEQEMLTRWSKEKGDDHYFFKVYGIDETTGDTALIRSNYFYANLAPYETKEIKVKLTSDCSNDVWMTIPSVAGYDDPYPPLLYWDVNNSGGGSGGSGSGSGGSGSGGSGSGGSGSGGSGSGGSGSGGSGSGSGGSGSGSGGSGSGSGSSGSGSGSSGSGSGSSGSGSGGSGGSSGYCCAQERIQCTLELVCDGLDVAGLFPGASNIVDIASCICETAQNTNEVVSKVVCEGEGWGDAWGDLNKRSVASWIFSCGSAITNGSLGLVMKAADLIMGAWTLNDMIGNNGQKDLESQVSDCVTKWTKRQPDCPPPPPNGGESTPINSFDPNDIHGYLSESGSHYMRQEIQNIRYEIEFENDTTLATAAAHTIIVRDTLDATKFDLNSLAAHSVTIGDKRLELNGEQNFACTLDMRPELYVIAQINQNYDPTTGIIEWTIQSLDPMTMEPTDNPYQGVLPVNYSGDGIGFIDYSINLLQAFNDGTEVSNRAGIIFDQNEVIMTPSWTNIVDAVKPTSHIEEVTFEADTLNFNFVSSDSRSGVWYHTLYYRNDSTEMEWKVKVPKVLENNCLLHFDEYQTTEYLVMAVDSAGNVEDKEMVAEYIHYYDGPGPVTQTSNLAQGWNWWSTSVDITLDELKSALVDALGGTTITIVSQSDGNTTYNGSKWRGQLTTMDVTQMYMIKTNAVGEMTLTGTPINLSDFSITIHNGFNWIGFPFFESISLGDAFAGFAVSGDMVVSQSGSALYNGTKWRGNLINFEPGLGYLYKSIVSGDRIFTFPISTK